MEKCLVSPALRTTGPLLGGKVWRNGEGSPLASHKFADGFLCREAGFPLKEGGFPPAGRAGLILTLHKFHTTKRTTTG